VIRLQTVIFTILIRFVNDQNDIVMEYFNNSNNCKGYIDRTGILYQFYTFTKAKNVM